MGIQSIYGTGNINSFYSWYTPGSAGTTWGADSFDEASVTPEDVSDGTDGLAPASAEIIQDTKNDQPPSIEPVNESTPFSSDWMGADSSDVKASMEELQMVAIGFHTRHRFEIGL